MTAMSGEDEETVTHRADVTQSFEVTQNIQTSFVLSPETPFDRTKGPEDPAQFHFVLPNEPRPDGTTESQSAIFMGFKIYPKTSTTKEPTMCLKVGAINSDGKLEKKAIPLQDTDRRCRGLNNQKLRFEFNGSNDGGETESGWMFVGINGDLTDQEHTMISLAKPLGRTDSEDKMTENVIMKTYTLQNFRNRNPKIEVQLPAS